MVQSRVRTERQRTTSTDFAKEIASLSETPESMNILVYGDSTVGKTVLAGTVPGKTLWLVGEPGYKSAALRGATGHVRHITDASIAWAAIDWLRERNRAERLDWLVVDGMTTMQDKIRLGYTAEAFDIDPTKRAHRNLPDRPDYYNTQNFVKAWFGALVDLPVNLLVTAHAYRTDKTENGELLTFPGFQGKVTEVANAVAGLMDIVGYYALGFPKRKGSERKLVRRLFFESPTNNEDVRYICGDKFGKLPKYLDFPTIPEILSIVEGTYA